MFDESTSQRVNESTSQRGQRVNEGNQIAKAAESAAFRPAGLGLLGLDEDGTACSADYYLRLTGDGGRILKDQIPLTPTRPTAPTTGAPPATVSLRSRAGGRLVCAENAGAAPLNANRDAIGPWERFDRIGAYVCAESAGRPRS